MIGRKASIGGYLSPPSNPRAQPWTGGGNYQAGVRVDILEGDGGVGTVIKVTFPPGTPLLTSHKEKFVVIDDEKRVKIAQVVEGGLLDLGCTLYKVNLEVIEKEIEVPVPANEAWKIYGTIQLAHIVVKELPNIVHRADILEGDGGVGTVIKVTFPPGTPLLTSHKEKFVVIDDEKRVKIAQVVEGGLLDLGFTLYKVKFEVIEKDKETCITKATIEYEVKEEAIANVSYVSIQPFKAIMDLVAKCLTQGKDGQSSV
ncbi:norbelladine synthase-like [Solanum dulcamara]|uniref:norbelladine synthase-like n=1 Tax=Solanum dulcamara TaxID=45834 RepID=UPI002486B5FD|nr:norbelladine synthase-like [Solanum dulcamara]